MQLLVKGDGMDGMSMHLVDTTGTPLCGMRFNRAKWHLQDYPAPTGTICAHCRHQQLASSSAAREQPSAREEPMRDA